MKFLNFTHRVHYFITFYNKVPYNANSDWLKQRALSENRARVDEGKLLFKFLLQSFDKFDLNLTSPVTQTKAMETSYLSAVNMVHRDHC